MSDISGSLVSSKLELTQSSGIEIQSLLSLDGAPLVTMVTGTRNPHADSVRREHCKDISQAKEMMALSLICCVMSAAFLTDPLLDSAFYDSSP